MGERFEKMWLLVGVVWWCGVSGRCGFCRRGCVG